MLCRLFEYIDFIIRAITKRDFKSYRAPPAGTNEILYVGCNAN